MDFQIERIFKGPGFAETLYLGTCDGRRIIRKASNPDAYDFSRTALVREIRVLENLSDRLAPFFPELIRTNLGDEPEHSPGLPGIIFYDMPYYAPEDGWGTLSQCMLDGSLSFSDARRALAEIVDLAFEYFRMQERKPEPGYAEATMLRSIRENLAWAEKDPDFGELLALRNVRLSGRPVRNLPEIFDRFQDSDTMRSMLTPHRDRFLHGDFFPENILYNRRTKRWILIDPVSVRGIQRGDFVLDLNKMDDWLSGELPALRLGLFSWRRDGNDIEFAIHTDAGQFEHLHRLGLSGYYRDLLRDPKFSGMFAEESGWRKRWLFVKAFYCLCMLPLAKKELAIGRYFLALETMDEFLKKE